MVRPYKGLDHTKVTVKLSDKQSDEKPEQVNIL